MITIHEKTAKTFDTLGLGALLPASCFVTEELNGAFELEMEHRAGAYPLRAYADRAAALPHLQHYAVHGQHQGQRQAYLL